MSVGDIERKTQNRVVELFRDRLELRVPRRPGGPGQHQRRRGRAAPEPPRSRLRRRDYQPGAQPTQERACTRRRAFRSTRPTVTSTASCATGSKSGARIREQTETVWLIDWARPEANHFAIAEEVTVLGQHTKRPDLVLYVNGIALVTSRTQALEGRRVARASGRPSATRSRSSFAQFFTTVQLCMAGNDVRACATE